MVLVDNINVEPNGNDLNGIIYYIKSTLNIADPISEGIVTPSGTEALSSYTNIDNTIVGWSKTCWITVSTSSNPFYQVYFPKHWIRITGYSLRSCDNGFNYPKKWKVYGFSEENKNEESQWDELGENTSTADQPYCYTTSTSCYGEYKVGTFTTKKMNKFYKYIRFVLSQASSSSYPCFQLSGFDIFGTLSSSKLNVFPRRTICTCIRKRRIISPDITNIIIGMSVMQS